MSDAHSAHLAPDRDTLVELLKRWQSGGVDHWGVVEEAEALEESLWQDVKVLPQAEMSDPCSIALAVLDLLSSAHISWVLPADIPMLLGFLETPAGEESEGWKRFDAYWEEIDMDAREQESNALYFGEVSNAE